MTRFLFLSFIAASIISCTTKTEKPANRVELIKQYDYLISIDISNGYTGHASKFILDNRRIQSHDSAEIIWNLPRPLTLYYISSSIPEANSENSEINTLTIADTIQIPFSKELSDSLFNLTKNFIKGVVFNNYDTAINGRITQHSIFDDSRAKVGLSYNGRKLYATINSIHNPTEATKELDTLLHFIYRFDPINKK